MTIKAILDTNISAQAPSPRVPHFPRVIRCLPDRSTAECAHHPGQLRNPQAPEVKKWFAAHPRYHIHFTPTGSSWLNQIERWFAEITAKRIRRGTFRSVKELTGAIESYIRDHNRNPKPFVWTATARSILRKVKNYKETLETHTRSSGQKQELTPSTSRRHSRRSPKRGRAEQVLGVKTTESFVFASRNAEQVTLSIAIKNHRETGME